MRSPKEILREYVFHLDGMSESIKARVMRDLEPNDHAGPYSWDVSHFSREAASSHHHANTEEEARSLMLEYVRSLSAQKIYAKNICY